MRAPVPILAALALVAAASCSDGPTAPTRRNPSLSVTCVPAGTEVSCTATLYDVPAAGSVRDVTQTAVWMATDPSVGSFSAPGVFTPSRRGEVGLWARHDDVVAELQSWFLVDPGAPARRLYWLAGVVTEAATGTPIDGALVRMLDGYAAGAVATTNSNGHYQIDNVLTGETFSVRASKDGFLPSTQSYRVDSPVGPSGNPPFLDFTLQPAPASARP